ncbi:uncharacterized protein BJX67DRAFT_378797 [Aspergillus lucknowensis]|uniref:Zn(2)-C6 fungal-type domain-containing protein n=1 Tax=Aspergillus lucknowensis TaxID=176173 RepID=A0ABR4M2B5_9EURO
MKASDEAARAKKVRKGTHSCRECRRRKVRCTFASSRDAICIPCYRRGTSCISQGVVDGLDKDEATSDQPLGGITHRSLHNNSVGSSHSAENAPYRSKQERDGDCSHPGQLEQSSTQVLTPSLSATPASSHLTIPTITQTLLGALPPRRDIEILLAKVNAIPTLCYQANFKARTAPPNELLQEHITISSLLDPEAHPVLLARQMLRFATALRHLSPTAAIPGLTKHHHAIMEDLAESAIQMVTTNDALLGTLEGLETIVLEAFYHVDSGNIRRAWITLRRAVMGAQLLGLHQPGHHRYKLINEQNELDPEVMWESIALMECISSLLLGLPTSTCTSTACPAVPETTSDPVGGCSWPTLSVRVAARILERNQLPVGDRCEDITANIDRELIRLAEKLPTTFWQPLSFSGLTVDSPNAFWETRRAWDQMCYYTLVSQLHLPYMLCPRRTPQVLYSRLACVSASRELLTRHIALRTFNPLASSPRLDDFMALIAGMTLMLMHLVGHSLSPTDNLLAHQRLGDRATVEQALETMKSMSEMHEDVPATRSVALLKDLLELEAGAALRHRSNDVGDTRTVLTIRVPYNGTIQIDAKGIRHAAPSDTEQHSVPQHGVVIGGIEFMEVKGQTLADHRASHPTSDAAHSEILPSTQPPAWQVEQPVAAEYFAENEMFPDAAASMDDWVFQGVDSAFFDVLMRGTGDNQVP